MNKKIFSLPKLLKKITMLFCILFLTPIYSQAVGIGTKNPFGVFHIDAAEDNLSSGKPTIAQQANDFIVTKDGNVGIGTAFPTNKLHINATPDIEPLKIDNLQKDDINQNQILVVDENNIVKKVPSPPTFTAPTTTLFLLKNMQADFLLDAQVGESRNVDMDIVENSIKGLEYDKISNTITFPTGKYQIIFTYGAVRKICELSSYFIDFPSDDGTLIRMFNTSGNVSDSGDHSGTFIHTFNVTEPIKWQIKLGRGGSGDCNSFGANLLSNVTQLIVSKF